MAARKEARVGALWTPLLPKWTTGQFLKVLPKPEASLFSADPAGGYRTEDYEIFSWTLSKVSGMLILMQMEWKLTGLVPFAILTHVLL